LFRPSGAKLCLPPGRCAARYETRLIRIVEDVKPLLATTDDFDLRIAAKHLFEQEAQIGITRSQRFPTVAVGGSAVGEPAGNFFASVAVIPDKLLATSSSCKRLNKISKVYRCCNVRTMSSINLRNARTRD
jgi:hypothetical protein